MLLCPVCGSDAADTLGVTGRLADPLDAVVVMRCESCATAYLSPAPSQPAGPARQSADSTATRRLIRRWAKGAHAASNVLVIDDSNSAPGTGPYEVILLPETLESSVHPAALLGQARKQLAASGRAIVMLGNAASSCFAVFGGRHWSGYQNPGVRQQLTSAALRRLCDIAGFRVARLETLFASDCWLDSTRNWLRDWGAGRALTFLLTGPWLVPQVVAALLEALAVARGRGALLIAELESP